MQQRTPLQQIWEIISWTFVWIVIWVHLNAVYLHAKKNVLSWLKDLEK